MTRIAISAYLRGNNWLGGVSYFRSLVSALRKYPVPNEFSVIILTNQSEAFGFHNDASVNIIDAPWLDSFGRFDYLLNGVIKTSGLINPLLYRYAKKSGIDLITHSPVNVLNACPTLFWMQDFQHCYFPEYFSRYERARRDRNIRLSSKAGDILFSSNSAAKDFRQFFPELTSTRIHVLQFAPLLDDNNNLPTRHELSLKYKFFGDYFFLPNQFWQHKNHSIVVEALRRLPSTFQVVATGILSDSRSNNHIQDILERIDRYSLNDRFKILGVIPRKDLLGLMLHSLCVINPSLFEGWSTTVEEAKYLGKRLLLSDISVHREQNPLDAIFFSPLEPDELAQAMHRVKEEYSTPREQTRWIQGRDAYETSAERFSSQYIKIAKKILSLEPPDNT